MRLEIKIIFKWLCIIMLLLGLFLLGATIWYINQLKNRDEQAAALVEQFYEDLLEGNYEDILTYTYIPNGETITAEDVESYILSYEGMSFILENPDRIEVKEFGNTELRKIEVKGYDSEENYYYFLIDVKFDDEKMFLSFNELKEN